MDFETLQRTIKSHRDFRIPLCLWGDAGESIRLIAKDMGLQYVSLDAHLLGPENACLFTSDSPLLPTSGEGILLIANLSSSAPVARGQALTLAFDRKLGEYRLPDGWRVMIIGDSELAKMDITALNHLLHIHLH